MKSVGADLWPNLTDDVDLAFCLQLDAELRAQLTTELLQRLRSLLWEQLGWQLKLQTEEELGEFK